MPHLPADRYAALSALSAVFMAVALITRIGLCAAAISQGELTASALPEVIAYGMLFDSITALFLFAPFALYLFLLPDRIYQSRPHRLLLQTAFFLVLFGLIYLAAVEWFFFDEFNSRFNFIAVEYLVYPHEVFVNIWESYPVAQVLLASAALAAGLFCLLKPTLSCRSRLRHRARPFAVYATAVLLAGFGGNLLPSRIPGNRVANEIAQNGIHTFFSALLNKDLDYRQYYLTLAKDEAAERLRRLVAQPNVRFFSSSLSPIARHIENPGPPKPLNVIVLMEESLGAEFVGAYGDARGLTPNIDRIAQRSLKFSNVYATGSRTVRGLEAVSASFPPVPAESIVKRPHNEGMFNWSTVMAKNGYSPTFIYGGYGAFDNMNYFFGHNGYRVVDRTEMDAPSFSNIWGISDEDLFRNAIRVFDGQYAHGEKIFSIVMTTSNHKPFTFPEGVPGVPASGGGRSAGVRYADHAIGKFFDAIKNKPYFDDTVIIIVGDHGARVYGKEDIPLKSYELPLLIHAPKHFAPRVVDTLASQIDIAPTVLALLGVSYDAVFFGKDILSGDPNERFVPINHNRDIALLGRNQLAELNFNKVSTVFLYDKRSDRQVVAELDDDQLKNAISVFQTAYDLYVGRRYR